MAAVVVSEKSKKLRGTSQPCRKMRQVSASDKVLTIEPPVNLTADAREAWKMAIECAPKGHLTALDATVLERWARNYALYRKISKELEGDKLILTDMDTGEIQLDPVFASLFTPLIKIQQILSACEKELGFTPVSRARVRRAGDDEPQDGGDFADF